MHQNSDKLQKLIREALQRRGGKPAPLNASTLYNMAVPKGVEKVKSIRSNNNKNVQELRNEAYKGRNLLDRVRHFASTGGNLYLTFGGVGDLVLLLGECYNDKSAKVFFFANQPSVEFANQFVSFFGLKSFISPILNVVKFEFDFGNEIPPKSSLPCHLITSLPNPIIPCTPNLPNLLPPPK